MGEERSGTSEVEVEDTDDDNVFNSSTQSEAISAKSLIIASTTPEAAKSSSSSSNASSSGSAAISKSDSISHQKPPTSVRVVTSPLVTHLSTPSSSLPSSTLPASSRKASLDSVSRYARTPKYRTIVPNPGHRPLTPYQIALGHSFNRHPWHPMGMVPASPPAVARYEEERIDSLIEDAKIQTRFKSTVTLLEAQRSAESSTKKSSQMEQRENASTCNLGNSRDWRRSIHFAGDHIKVLIKCKILNVHAQSCNCSICSPETGTSKPKKHAQEGAHSSSYGSSTDSSLLSGSDASGAYLFHDIGRQSNFVKNLPLQINIIVEYPTDPSRLPSGDELELIEAALEQNRLDRERLQGDYISSIGAFENKIQQMQEELKSMKASFAEGFKAISTETDRLNLSLLTYCRNRKARQSDSPGEINGQQEIEPRSAPAEYQARRKQNYLDKRRTNSDTSMMESAQKKCSNRSCFKKAEWRCRGCSKAYYCSKTCQEHHWAYGHDSECDSDD
ncbi:Oidioi.mRNA.OKI2018_I69.PAR.g10418.t1.cds [Oikopleura dioica]|uniref:Oidioi.mRNA.OKI2018_I69.PAR.g10418.t1.cds n=1 Tax=Oikopleura dioica TaxID=34765 RepID=A0ABN7RQJ5_OIKDI|nr:Oidioi.mRNA.OKI2018_I69.PAR.g10418.t1.cds [Oikopleura dioica]